MALTYTSQTDFEAYVEGWVTDDPAALARLLERAERDIDSVLGGWGLPDETTGLKVILSDLEAWQAAALSRAVCAQAEYRFKMGEDFMSSAQHRSSTGPDFSVTGTLPYIGPKAIRELDSASLRSLAGRATPGVGRGRMLADRFFRSQGPGAW